MWLILTLPLETCCIISLPKNAFEWVAGSVWSARRRRELVLVARRFCYLMNRKETTGCCQHQWSISQRWMRRKRVQHHRQWYAIWLKPNGNRSLLPFDEAEKYEWLWFARMAHSLWKVLPSMLIPVIWSVSLDLSGPARSACFSCIWMCAILHFQSSLLQTLTGEIAYFDGKVRLNGSFCYVPQESCKFVKFQKSISETYCLC